MAARTFEFNARYDGSFIRMVRTAVGGVGGGGAAGALHCRATLPVTTTNHPHDRRFQRLSHFFHSPSLLPSSSTMDHKSSDDDAVVTSARDNEDHRKEKEKKLAKDKNTKGILCRCQVSLLMARLIMTPCASQRAARLSGACQKNTLIAI